MSYVYAICTPLVPEGWYELCRCDTPESAGDVIRALLSSSHPPAQILLRLLPV